MEMIIRFTIVSTKTSNAMERNRGSLKLRTGKPLGRPAFSLLRRRRIPMGTRISPTTKIVGRIT